MFEEKARSQLFARIVRVRPMPSEASGSSPIFLCPSASLEHRNVEKWFVKHTMPAVREGMRRVKKMGGMYV
jgi:hypothetical protein